LCVLGETGLGDLGWAGIVGFRPSAAAVRIIGWLEWNGWCLVLCISLALSVEVSESPKQAMLLLLQGSNILIATSAYATIQRMVTGTRCWLYVCSRVWCFDMRGVDRALVEPFSGVSGFRLETIHTMDCSSLHTIFLSCYCHSLPSAIVCKCMNRF
jgi:hypothetical protein